jgi:urease accessory protein
VAPRAYASPVHIGSAADVRTGVDAVRLPLTDGWLATAWGTELHRVVSAVDALTPGTAARVPA